MSDYSFKALEIPKAEELLPKLFTSNTDSDRQLLQIALKSYHGIPLQKEQLWSRIDRLMKVDERIDTISRKPNHGADPNILKSFGDHVNRRLVYLKVLFRYTHQKKKKAKLSELLKAFSSGKNYRQMKNDGSYYLSMHSTQLVEKIDPLHRRGIFDQHYRNYVREEIKQGRDPADGLVDFILSLEKKNYLQKADYFKPDYSDLLRLIFKEKKAWAYYLTTPEGKFRRITSLKEKEDVSLEAYDSVCHENYKNEFSLRDFSDLLFGDIYVMRKGILYTYPTKEGRNFHSMGVQGKAIQAAGIIVVKEGKVQAIDNKSGHYRPTWRHLLQACTLIQENDAFADEAVVSVVVNKDYSVFFRADDFINLARNNFPFKHTIDILQHYIKMYGNKKPYPPSMDQYLRALVRDTAGQIFDYSDAIVAFLELIYPEDPTKQALQKQNLNLIWLSRRSWTYAQWKKESYVGLFATRIGPIGGVDVAYRDFDKGYNRFVMYSKNEASVNKYYRLNLSTHKELDAVINKAKALIKAINVWLSKKEGKDSVRRSAVLTAEELVQEDLERLEQLAKSQGVWSEVWG